MHGDFESWNRRRLEGEPIVRLILDGTVVHVRLDGASTALSILVAMGVRADGQRMLLALKALAGESEARLARSAAGPGVSRPEPARAGDHRRWRGTAWRQHWRGMWPSAAVQRCTVHKLRNLIAHAPKKLHERRARRRVTAR